MTLPRRPTAVPQTWPVRLEIAKAIHMLVAQVKEEQQLQRRAELAAVRRDCELLTEALRDFCRDLAKAGFREDQPRWPKGSGEDSGRWSGGAGAAPPAPAKTPPEKPTPRSWRVDPSQHAPGEEPPKIPAEAPQTEHEIWNFAKTAAIWLAKAGLRPALEVGLEATLGGPVGDFLLAMEAAYWLYRALPYIYSYLDPPKTWEELQQNRGPGYDEHHVVERWSEQDGISSSAIYSSGNEVPIPTLKHWEINGWLDSLNEDFKDADGDNMSPREYLKGKSWEERWRIGIYALTKFGVLKP